MMGGTGGGGEIFVDELDEEGIGGNRRSDGSVPGMELAI
jgi:hypothetical protein